MTVRWRGHHHFDRISVDNLDGYGVQVKGIKHYCDWNSGSDTNSGSSWDKAFKTITHALSIAGNNGIIVIGTGIYLEGATLAITENELKLIGVQSSGWTFGQPSIHTHGTETLITVNPTGVGQVEIADLSFHDQGAGKSLLVGNLAAVWRLHVHNCFFGGNGVALNGIDVGSTHDAPFAIIEDCYFENYVTACINQNAYNSMVRRCQFNLRTNQKGITYAPNAASRPFGSILSNKFVTLDGTNSVGVNVSNTPTAGYLLVDDNRFVNFADDDHCIRKRTGYTGLNYLGITAIPIT